MTASGKYLLLVFFFVGSYWGLAQKLVEKSILNPQARFVEINGKDCFKVSLKTHATPVIRIEASLEGEYAKDLAIKMEEDGANIFISAAFLPSFSDFNDKLSAHKVISIELKITLPEFMKVSFYSTNTNLIATGSYNSLGIQLDDGKCTLSNITHSINVKTQRGEIRLQQVAGTIKAKSECGKISKGAVLEGSATFDLYSVEGDIFVNLP